MGFSWDGLVVAGGRAFHEEQSLPGKGRPRKDFPRPFPRTQNLPVLRRSCAEAARVIA